MVQTREPLTRPSTASWSIGEVSRGTGLSKDTLRYYEKEGLLDRVERSGAGRRRYASADLDWLAFLLRLRATGMPVATMRRFAELRRAGPATLGERMTLLAHHRVQVSEHLSELGAHLGALDLKIDPYERLLTEQAETEGT